MLGKLLGDVFRHSRRGEEPADDGRNPLAEYFFHSQGRRLDKWEHYFEIYHRHFARFRGRSPIVLEVGVLQGGSIEMWHRYFGPGTRVVGIDIEPRCRSLEDEATRILIGDQADRTFLASVRETVPRIDILIDDGGHKMAEQITTFEELYPHVQPHGVYLCEDMHTSLWPEYGGGRGREGSFLEYGKALVDRLYAWHSRDAAVLAVDAFTTGTHSLHFYDSVLVVEKRPTQRPRYLRRAPAD